MERQVVVVFADDDIRKKSGVGHAFVKRSGRKGCYLEGFPVRILHLKPALENVLVADDPADVHLPGHEYQAVRHLGCHLDIVLRIVKFRIAVFLLHFQAAGVDGLADLAVVGIHVNELVLLRGGLCRLLVQPCLFLGVHLLDEEAAREFLGLFRKADALRLLAEVHLRVFCKRPLGEEEALLQECIFSLQSFHPFLFFGGHLYPFFLYVKVRKNGHICKYTAVFLQLIPLIFRRLFSPPMRRSIGRPEGPSTVVTDAVDHR